MHEINWIQSLRTAIGQSKEVFQNIKVIYRIQNCMNLFSGKCKSRFKLKIKTEIQRAMPWMSLKYIIYFKITLLLSFDSCQWMLEI